MKSKYVVECGAEKAEYSDLENAIARAQEMAMELAEDQGLSFDRLGEYGSSPRWGVCPEGDDGAYWPTVTEIKGVKP
jgi:hypothetical protein